MSRPVGYKHAAETRQKISAALRGRPRSNAEELRRRMRAFNAARKGIRYTEFRIEQLRASTTASHRSGLRRPDAIKGDCAYCGRPGSCKEHILPISRGGGDEPNNLTISCHSCNLAKGNRTLREWLAVEQGRFDRGILAAWRLHHLEEMLR